MACYTTCAPHLPWSIRRLSERFMCNFVLFYSNIVPVAFLSYLFDVRLPKPREDGMTSSTVVQPDLTVVCDRNKLDKRGVVGAPDLLVEVLSPYTAKKDRQQKMRAYAQTGVREYWIISPSEQTVEVYLLQQPGSYGVVIMYQYNEQVPVGVLPGLVIDLTQVFVAE